MNVVLEGVAAAVQPWADLYADSTTLATVVEFMHLGGLLLAGGFALAFDRMVLRVDRGIVSDRAGFLRELSAVHAPVMVGLVVVIVSGLALMAADIEVMLPSRLFWLKMGAFVLLLLNGIALRRAGGRLRRTSNDEKGWSRLRQLSLRSIGLWVAVLFLGVLLTAAA